MNKRAFLRNTIFAGLTLALPSCFKRGNGTGTAGVDYYTCSMHPFVRSKTPGKCPVCSMDLIPVMLGANVRGGDSGPKEFFVPVERQQQIGVTYATVGKKRLRRNISAAGVVAFDAQRHWAYVARVDGYVQQLFVTTPGESVARDQPLVSIYSPDLLTTEREYVMLVKMRDEARADERDTRAGLVDAAKSRLKQWNMTDAQIADLEKTRKPSDTLTLLSPFSGVIQEVPVHQGVNVKIGDHLVDVADLSSVWVWADFYENELSALRQGRKVVVTVTSFPGEKFDREIAVVNPFLDESQRTIKVRIDIQNPDIKLRPGMYAAVGLEADMGEGLAVPVSAIIPTGVRNVAFVDKGDGRLEPRFVQLGGEYGDDYEVKSGLSEGERVVSSANFLIDAESKVQGALKDFGSTPEGGQ